MAVSLVKVPVKEFKELLKSMVSFADRLGGNFGLAASITVDPPALRLTSELASLEARLPAVEASLGAFGHFHFHMDQLAKLSYTGKQLCLSWSDLNTLNVECGSFRASMKIAASIHTPVEWQDIEASGRLPCPVLVDVEKYADIPHSYVDLDKDKTTVELSIKDGVFLASCEDSFSFIRLTYDGGVEGNFEMQVPHFALSSVVSKAIAKDGEFVLGVSGTACYFSTPVHTLCMAGLSVHTNKWEDAERAMGEPTLSFVSDADSLTDAVKPLFDMIPAKEKSSALINMHSSAPDSIEFSLSQPGFGTASSTVLVSALSGSSKINLHPQAFYDFLSMMSSLDSIKVDASSVATKLTGKTKSGCVVEYMLTNVQL